MIKQARNIQSYSSQQGIGMIEVLVALLLLAIAAFGYVALQTRALKTTDEALIRTQALAILRTSAEKIRVNGLQNTYTLTVTQNGTSTTTTGQILDYYENLFNKEASDISQHNCVGTVQGCNPQQIADNDVKELKTIADGFEIKLGMVGCPQTTKSKCLVAAWNETSPTKNDAERQHHCFKNNGAYHFNADCVYMESY